MHNKKEARHENNGYGFFIGGFVFYNRLRQGQDLMPGEHEIWGYVTKWGHIPDYLRFVIYQHPDLESYSTTWDEYIQGLNQLGLQEYIELYSLFALR
jgi:hypothetical protein